MGNDTFEIEYAALMDRNPEGTYLYIPQSFRKFHPGSVGFFDESGAWNEVADVSKADQPDEFTAFTGKLSYDDEETMEWKTRSSEGESGNNIRASAGLSAAAASAVPVDVSVEGKHKTSSSKKAALVAKSAVMKKRYKPPFDPRVQPWVNENAKVLMEGDWARYIKANGLWAIQSTWVTDECAIKMTNKTDNSLEAGLDVAATGIGKVGGGGGTFDKLENEGWTTYKSNGSDGGKVIAFSGVHYKARTFHRIQKIPLKEKKASKYLRTGDDQVVAVLELGFEGELVGLTPEEAQEQAEIERLEEQERHEQAEMERLEEQQRQEESKKQKGMLGRLITTVKRFVTPK